MICIQLGQHLVKHVISRCAVASSSDDIVITALDAVYWTKSAWENVTQSTICNTFRTAGFVSSKVQDTNTSMIDNDNGSDEEVATDDISTALQSLDTLLTHINIGGQSLSAKEFIDLDAETPAFNEWNDVDDDLIIINEQSNNEEKHNNNKEEDDDDMPTETPPKLTEAMEMIRRLHLLAATQQPQLHSLISQLDSQLTQLFIDSKGAKQTKINDFFHKK